MDGMSNKELDEVNDLLNNFHRCLHKLLNLAKDKNPTSADVAQVERLVKLCKEEDPLELIERCQDKIWDSQKKILERDETYFIAGDFNQYIRSKSRYEGLQHRLIALFKDHFKTLTPEEKEVIWRTLRDMLALVATYKLKRGYCIKVLTARDLTKITEKGLADVTRGNGTAGGGGSGGASGVGSGGTSGKSSDGKEQKSKSN